MRPPPEATPDAVPVPADAPSVSAGGAVASTDVPVTLGRITAVSGLKGWVKVHSDTEPRENIVRFTTWLLRPEGAGVGPSGGTGSAWRPVQVLDGRAQGKTIVARLEGIEDRDAAGALVGSDIAVRREALPPVAPDEHYWADLVGMQVVTVQGLLVGPVDRLFETGANDVMVVGDARDGAKAGAEVLVPWVRPDVIVEVDAGARRIVIDWDPDF